MPISSLNLGWFASCSAHSLNMHPCTRHNHLYTALVLWTCLMHSPTLLTSMCVCRLCVNTCVLCTITNVLLGYDGNPFLRQMAQCKTCVWCRERKTIRGQCNGVLHTNAYVHLLTHLYIIHTHTYTHNTHTHTHTHIRTHTHAHTHTHTRTHTHAHTPHIHMYRPVHTCTQHAHTYTVSNYMHTYTHAHIPYSPNTHM